MLPSRPHRRPIRPIRLTRPIRSRRTLRTATATRTATANTRRRRAKKQRSQRAPTWGPFLFGVDGVEQRGRVIVVPDQGRQILAIWFEGDRLLIDIGVDGVEGPITKLLIAQPGMEALIALAGSEEASSRIVDRFQDAELRFQLLDDRDGRPLELQLGDAATQIADLNLVLVHETSLFGVAAFRYSRAPR